MPVRRCVLPRMGEMKTGNGHTVCTEKHRKEIGVLAVNWVRKVKETKTLKTVLKCKVNGSQNVEEAPRQAV